MSSNVSTGKRKVEALELVLESPSVPVKKPRLGAHPRLLLDTRNCVVGSVNGTTCSVQLDSGSNVTFLFWSTAKRLGLITGNEASVTRHISLWIGVKELQVVELESITINLGSGVSVVTPATVFPEWLEIYYDPEDVVLDAHHLRRGRMVQVFRPEGSDVLVRKPKQLLRRVRRSRRPLEADVLNVRLADSRKRKTMTMLIDTGTDGIYVSEKRLNLLTEGSKNRTAPERVVLDIGDGYYLHAKPLQTVTSDDDDFIIGTTILAKYNTVMDYSCYTLTFQIGSNWRKVTMETPYSV